MESNSFENSFTVSLWDISEWWQLENLIVLTTVVAQARGRIVYCIQQHPQVNELEEGRARWGYDMIYLPNANFSLQLFSLSKFPDSTWFSIFVTHNEFLFHKFFSLPINLYELLGSTSVLARFFAPVLFCLETCSYWLNWTLPVSCTRKGS